MGTNFPINGSEIIGLWFIDNIIKRVSSKLM